MDHPATATDQPAARGLTAATSKTSVAALAAENELLRKAAIEVLLQTLELRQKVRS
jgi:hypothetical protein